MGTSGDTPGDTPDGLVHDRPWIAPGLRLGRRDLGATLSTRALILGDNSDLAAPPALQPPAFSRASTFYGKTTIQDEMGERVYPKGTPGDPRGFPWVTPRGIPQGIARGITHGIPRVIPRVPPELSAEVSPWASPPNKILPKFT